MTEYTGDDQYQYPESTTILSTTSASRKRIREDPTPTAVLDTLAPTSPAEEGTTVAISNTTGRGNKKAAVEGTWDSQKDGEPINNNQVTETTTAKKIPAALWTKPTINTSSPPVTAKATAASDAKVKAPTKKPTTQLPYSSSSQIAKGKISPTSPTNPSSQAKTQQVGDTGSVTVNAKQDGIKAPHYNSNATTKKAQDTLKEPLKTFYEQEPEKRKNLDRMSKSDDNSEPTTSASMKKSGAKTDTVKISKEAKTTTPSTITMNPKKGSTPTSKHTDKLFRGTRVARKIKGTVVQGQVDVFNGTHYFCTFRNGLKMRLTEESFQEALYVDYL
jgi:hypothetical protein